MDNPLTTAEWDRYARQLALPEVTASQQIKLKQARILMIGAGGLGSSALPYLAAAGIGHITIMDNDVVDTTNLHRQTIYKDTEAGQSKAELAAAYLKSLNPHCDVVGINARFEDNRHCERSEAIQSNETGLPRRADALLAMTESFDLILDGSDNFETKTLLNEIAMEIKAPLISASINRFEAQIGLFTGHAADQPCYHCLFPNLPQDACNCNEAGVLGTAAGLAGTYQAHMALCFLLGLDNVDAGSILTFDFKNFRVQHLKLSKDPDCKHCQDGQEKWEHVDMDEEAIELIDPKDLKSKDHIVIDVRTDEEVLADPIEGALHIELQDIPSRFSELPEDKLLAFACASNIRSMQAAEFMRTMGYEKVCVYDKLAV